MDSDKKECVNGTTSITDKKAEEKQISCQEHKTKYLHWYMVEEKTNNKMSPVHVTRKHVKSGKPTIL